MFKNNKEKDPLLDLILQKYIQTSRDSIHGPVALKTDKKLSVLNNKTNETKKILDAIPEESKLERANLDEHTVSGFIVGGEKRICFSEIVQAVLKDVNVQEIFKRRDNLLIFTSKCSQKQLDELKYHGVLPWTTTSSNLITKSDAFRLIGALQGNLAPKAETVKRSQHSFEVYHECFGGCIGLMEPDFYTSVSSPCIRCTECNGLFSTNKFVSHNHSPYNEAHTCHWGFDSTNWRIYTMLVEQTPKRELLGLWDSIRNKFNPNAHYSSLEKSDSKCQDADFVAYINSPDHKKAMVSPIENLRNREQAASSSTSSASVSAFRPWSPPPPSSSSSSKYMLNSSNSRFTFPNNSGQSMHDRTRDNCPVSPVYLNCKQCKDAAHATCPSGIHNRPDYIKEKGQNGNCNCPDCQKFSNATLEGSIEKILRNFTTNENQLTTSSRDLAKLLSNELKKLSLTNDEKVREISINNQRLQTELQLVKIESNKRLAEARDTKAHVEQELELLHRERQKEMSIFNQLQWELQNDIAKRKKSGTASEVETLQKEVTLLKTNLQQTEIDRENLRKQLDWHMKHRKSNLDKKIWTPYPTMARHFSDSEDEETRKPHKVSVVAKRDDLSETSAPASKSMRLDEKSDENSDIEVDD